MQDFNLFNLKASFFDMMKSVLLLCVVGKNYFEEITYIYISFFD